MTEAKRHPIMEVLAKRPGLGVKHLATELGESIKWTRRRLVCKVDPTLSEEQRMWTALDDLFRRGGWTTATLSTETGHRNT